MAATEPEQHHEREQRDSGDRDRESPPLVQIPGIVDDYHERLFSPGVPHVSHRFPDTPLGILMLAKLRKFYVVMLG